MSDCVASAAAGIRNLQKNRPQNAKRPIGPQFTGSF
jgi:hypothetical protein